MSFNSYGTGSRSLGNGGGLIPIKPDATCATVVDLNATYDNGVLGVNSTLTVIATGTLTIDTKLTTLGDTVLIKDQTLEFQNGIYRITTEGAPGISAILTRSTNFNSSATIRQYTAINVTSGDVNANTTWYESAPPPFVVGTTAIVFSKYNLGVSQITSGTTDSLTFNPITGAVVGSLVQSIATTSSPTFNFLQTSVNDYTAAGTDRATATALTTRTNNVTSVAFGTGVVLPSGTVGGDVLIINDSVEPLKVYAPGSATINGVAGVTGVTLTLSASLHLSYVDIDKWVGFGSGAAGVQSVSGNIVDNFTDPQNPVVTQVQSDWLAFTGLGQILNQPTTFPNKYWLPSCRAAMNGISPFDYIYNNGLSGQGAYVRNSGTQAPLEIDGVTLNTYDYVIWNPAAGGSMLDLISGGLYQVADVGSISTNWIIQRPTFYDSVADMVEGTASLVSEGTVYKGSIFYLETPPTTMGSPLIEFNDIPAGEVKAISGNIVDNTDPLNPIVNAAQRNERVSYTLNTGITYVIDPAVTGSIAISLNGNGTIDIGAPLYDYQIIDLQLLPLGGNYAITWGASIAFATGLPPIIDSINLRNIRLIGWSGNWYADCGESNIDVTAISAAGTINLDYTTSNLITVVGSTTITSIISSSGTPRTLFFANTPIITNNNTTLPLPGGANITAAAGDIMQVIGFDASAITVLNYRKADGTAVVGGGGAVNSVSGNVVDNTDPVNPIVNSFALEPVVAVQYGVPTNPYTYNNGSSGIGATITSNVNGALVIDGVTMSVGDDVVWAEYVTLTHNGLYTVTQIGSPSATYQLTRRADYDTTDKIFFNTNVFVKGGDTYAGYTFFMSNPAAITVGTTNIPMTGISPNELLGTMAFQDSFSVSVDGGNIDDTVIGAFSRSNAQFLQPINAQTGTTYTIVSNDCGKFVTSNNASAVTFTLPQQSITPTSTGFFFDHRNLGAGTVTFVTQGAETIVGNTTAKSGESITFRRSPTSTVWISDGGSFAVSPSVGIKEMLFYDNAGTVSNIGYYFTPSALYGFTIDSLTQSAAAIATAGTYTCTINGVNVTGLVNITNQTSATTTTATANNVVVPGDVVLWYFSGTVAVQGQFGQLNITRT